MARLIVPLAEKKVDKAKAAEKQYTLWDGGGLHLLVMPSGKKLWRLKYRFKNHERLMALGSYDNVSLKEARIKRDNLKKEIADGIDPAAEKKKIKAETTGTYNDPDSFEYVALEWHRKNNYLPRWKPTYGELILSRLTKDVFPDIGNIAISKIETKDLVKVLEKIEKRPAIETAHRIQGYITQICRHAVRTAKIKYNPATDLEGGLPPTQTKNYPALTKPIDIANYLQKINDPDFIKCRYVTKCLLLLQPLLFTRPGELRLLEWSEIDYEEKLIDIPATKMKSKKAHYVPLSRQAISILNSLKSRAGNSKYVFASKKDSNSPLSEHTANMALMRMGFQGELTPHGFRATARTVAREKLFVDVEYLEIQLAHKTMAPNGTAYDRVAFLPERHQIMQVWADYLDDLQVGRPAKKHWLKYLPPVIEE